MTSYGTITNLSWAHPMSVSNKANNAYLFYPDDIFLNSGPFQHLWKLC